MSKNMGILRGLEFHWVNRSELGMKVFGYYEWSESNQTQHFTEWGFNLGILGFSILKGVS